MVLKVPAPPQGPRSTGAKASSDANVSAADAKSGSASSPTAAEGQSEAGPKPLPRIFLKQLQAKQEREQQEQAQSARSTNNNNNAAGGNSKASNRNYTVASSTSLISPRTIANLGYGGTYNNDANSKKGDKKKSGAASTPRGTSTSTAELEIGWNTDVSAPSIFLGRFRDYSNPLFKNYEGLETKRSPRFAIPEPPASHKNNDVDGENNNNNSKSSSVPKLPPIHSPKQAMGSKADYHPSELRRDSTEKNTNNDHKHQQDSGKKVRSTGISFAQLKAGGKAPISAHHAGSKETAKEKPSTLLVEEKKAAQKEEEVPTSLKDATAKTSSAPAESPKNASSSSAPAEAPKKEEREDGGEDAENDYANDSFEATPAQSPSPSQLYSTI